MHPAVLCAQRNRMQFTTEFLDYLPDNLHVFDAFEQEVAKVLGKGFRHYSARTIIHFLRHHSAITEDSGSGWKINNNISPYFARLYVLMHPECKDIFEFREVKAALREQSHFVRAARELFY